MELGELQGIVSKGESETVEFKKSTGQLTRAGETLCAFLNGKGGRVFFGITPEGQIVGQHIADSTMRDLAEMLSHFEPAATFETSRVLVNGSLEVLVVETKPAPQSAPFAFEGRAYQRVGSTTSQMPQSELIQGEQPLNAAVVLFAKESVPFHAQSLLRLARFKGTDKSEFIDNRQVHGNAFVLLNEGMEFLRTHLPISGRFESGKLERIDELLFPPEGRR